MLTRHQGPNLSYYIEHPRHSSRNLLPKTRKKEFQMFFKLTKASTVADPVEFSKGFRAVSRMAETLEFCLNAAVHHVVIGNSAILSRSERATLKVL